MIFTVCIIMIFLGGLLTSTDLFVPLTDYATAQMVGVSNLFGIMFIIVGLIVLFVRGMQVGTTGMLDLPSSDTVKLFHHRRGTNPNVKVLNGKLLDNEYIVVKGKLFKDTGGGFRIAGHDCRSTHENIGFDIPEWLFDFFYQIRHKFGVRNKDQRIELAQALSRIHKPLFNDRKLLELELNKIPLLEPIMKDELKKKELLDMGFDRISKLELLCCDGTTHHHEEVESFIDSATPNDIDTLVKQKTLNEQMKNQNYKAPGSTFNYETLIPIFIALFIGILGAIVFMSYMGSGV